MKIATTTLKKWCKNNRKNHIDPETGECNTTALAEEAADVFDLYEEKVTYKIPEEVFEIALAYV